MWQELKDIDYIIAKKIDWRKMNASVIPQMIGLKERMLKRKEEDRIAKEEEIKKKEQEKIDKENYYKNFESIMVSKIDNKENLTESELSMILDYEIEKEYGENGRWSRPVDSIIALNDRYFLLQWEDGLTENQSSEFYNQPYEVELYQYEKTITIKEWKRKNNE